MTVYYNDNDARTVIWLQKLVKAGLIAKGVVDGRSIRRIKAANLEKFRQVHLFAGIGGWSVALRLAGWPDDKPVWTGSCPCQPFSTAGKQKGFKDKRHLWPEMCRLIGESRPPTVFGEQVASRLGRVWLAGVRADLEALGYAVGAADLCAAGVRSPHRRQRLFWVASTEFGNVADSANERRKAFSARARERPERIHRLDSETSPWDEYDTMPCKYGLCRRVEPGVHPLAYGIPYKVGLLRGYGNAIVPQLAAAFIRAYQETLKEQR